MRTRCDHAAISRMGAAPTARMGITTTMGRPCTRTVRRTGATQTTTRARTPATCKCSIGRRIARTTAAAVGTVALRMLQQSAPLPTRHHPMTLQTPRIVEGCGPRDVRRLHPLNLRLPARRRCRFRGSPAWTPPRRNWTRAPSSPRPLRTRPTLHANPRPRTRAHHTTRAGCCSPRAGHVPNAASASGTHRAGTRRVPW